MAQCLVRFVSCAVRAQGKPFVSRFPGSSVVQNLNIPKCHRSSKNVAVENQSDMVECGTSKLNVSVNKAKSKQEITTNDALEIRTTKSSQSNGKTNESMDHSDKLKSSAKVKMSAAKKSKATVGDEIFMGKPLKNSSKLKTNTNAMLNKATEKAEAFSEKSKSKTKKVSSVIAEKSKNPEIKTTTQPFEAEKSPTKFTESLLKTDQKSKTKKPSVNKTENNENNVLTKRSSLQSELKTVNKKANMTPEARNRTKKMSPVITDEEDEPKINVKNMSNADKKVKSFFKPYQNERTPCVVMPIAECDLINGRIRKDEKDSFKMFVEDFSLPYLPYVTSVLKHTQSDESKFFLERWKLQMIEELGLEGFTKMQEDMFRRGGNFHACVQERLSGKDMSEIQLQEDNQGHWQSIEKVFCDVDDVVALEKTVYHDSLLYNGKFDCLAVFRGELCVIDWKTSKKPKPLLSNTYDNPVQLAAYMGAINSTPVIPGIGVGHGHFKNGVFSKISITSLSGCGGIVHVGPFLKTGNTSSEIKKAAFEKFTQQNRAFRQKYKSNDIFNLVYPDGSLVDKLPGSEKEFSLLEYRNSLDPHKRFERLRLYLCTKSNYDLNQPFEIVSESSSSDELPDIFSPGNGRKDKTSSTQNNDSFTIDVIFYHQDTTYIETFPNNVKGSVLLGYLQMKINVQESSISMKIKNTHRLINADDRMMDIINVTPVEVEVEVHESTPRDESSGSVTDLEEPIRASYLSDSDSDIASDIVDKTISIMEGTSEPCAVLSTYQMLFLQGRPLDILEESSTIDGETTSIFISRSSLFHDAMEEIKFTENIRFPIEANFHGENAEDLGGPRREFFELFFKQFKEEMLSEENGNLVLSHRDENLARHRYFYAGIFIGLSVLQGGPLPDFLTTVLNNSPESEVLKQLVKGLRRTGLMQVDKVRKAAIVIAYSEGHPAHVHMMNIDTCLKYWTKWLYRLQLYWTLKYEEQQKPQKMDNI